MATAGIALDNWKYEIFERHLKRGGYKFKRTDGLTEDTMVLTVYTNNMQALGEILKAANTEAAMTGKPAV